MLDVRSDAEGFDIEQSKSLTQPSLVSLIWLGGGSTAACRLQAEHRTNIILSSYVIFSAYLLHVFPAVPIDIFGNFFLQLRGQLARV